MYFLCLVIFIYYFFLHAAGIILTMQHLRQCMQNIWHSIEQLRRSLTNGATTQKACLCPEGDHCEHEV